MKKYGLIFIIVLLPGLLLSQQLPVLTQAQVNPFLLNAAYAGADGYTDVFLHTRNMWTSMPEAPQQYFLTIDGALNNAKMALGFTLKANVEPVIRNVGALLTYRYKIRLAEQHFLSGGLSGGIVHNSLDFSRVMVNNADEVADFRGNWSKSGFDFNIGLLYQFKALEAGVAVKQLMNTPFMHEHTTGDQSLAYRLLRHYEVSLLYRWPVNRDFTLSPLFVMQSTEGVPFNFMLNAGVTYLDTYWLGAGYSYRSSYTIIAGLKVADRLLLGYSCDIAAVGRHAHFGVTHEITVGYRFGRQSGRSGASGRAERSALSAYQETLQQQYEEIDRLKQSNEVLKKRLDQQEEAASATAGQQQLLEIYARDRAFIDSLMTVYSVDMDSIDTADFQQKIYYVVVGAYYKLPDAKIFQRILEKELNLETRIVASSNGRYYFVYTTTPDTQQAAGAEYRRLMNMGIQQYIYGNLWIYSQEK